ncbi:hypothetical protein Q31b_49020 [Novipirellula aureliae]|uniref:Methyltransferase domain-containing protein n=1 Tax=Novipirellula aureliae TaxID=2527966 RepID=A0A5C6DLW3_9BACT|nr:methyltransferase domain-containing protein [Novipirellula aureliae]TWU36621.1 hypothetical protein Q31b_49020 [Novipirellula aureliae]
MKRIQSILFVTLAIAGFSYLGVPAYGQEVLDAAARSETESINKTFLDPNLDVEAYIDRFEVESREVYHARDEIMRHLNLKPGERAVDVGAGTGFYSLLMSEAVGDDGWVYAVEISPKFVEHLANMFDEREKKNITTVMCDNDSVCLPPRCVEVALICDVYHHFEYPEQTMKSIFDAMTDGGRLFVIDFERIPGKSRKWIFGHVRAGKQTFIDEIQSVGFELFAERKITGFNENYFLEFRKP